ncbi:MAG: translesion DNA synthesis-associated protein ImuA, partial [Xanthomonadales bacterium]|nr:translesion DNA synthesis-associated protein ImuA [Xanthomonadales bacterium]
MTGKTDIARLLDATPQLWTGRRFGRGQRTLPTGQARLDARLPGGGWPLGAVSEIVSANPGLGELSLLLPALAALGERGQWVVLVDPPWVPYPASLQARGLRLERLLWVRTRSEKESLWACEQALGSSNVSSRGGAVLAWPERIAFARLRRLQLAAEANGKLAFLFRPESALQDASPAALRLHLQATGPHDVAVRVVKCRGSRPIEPVGIPRPFALCEKAQDQTHAHVVASPSIPAPGP